MRGPAVVPTGATRATVVYARDGDTLELTDAAGQQQVRLLGIDAPEVHGATDGLFVNRELARLGYARELHIPPNGAYAAELHAAVEDARAARRGLWGVCVTGP